MRFQSQQITSFQHSFCLCISNMNNIQFIFSTLHNSIKYIFRHSLCLYLCSHLNLELFHTLLHFFRIRSAWDFMVSKELSEHKLQYVAFSNSIYSFIGTSIFLHSFSHQHVHIHQDICIKYSRNKHIGLLFLQELCKVANGASFLVGQMSFFML